MLEWDCILGERGYGTVIQSPQVYTQAELSPGRTAFQKPESQLSCAATFHSFRTNMMDRRPETIKHSSERKGEEVE